MFFVEAKTFALLTVRALPRTLSTKQLSQHPLVTQGSTLVWQSMNSKWDTTTTSSLSKTKNTHMTLYFQNTFGKHRLRDQLAHHQKGKRVQRQIISLQPMFSWKTLYLDRSTCLPFKQEIWAGNEMPSKKTVNQNIPFTLGPGLKQNCLKFL